MPIPLDDRAPIIPSIKLLSIGDHAVVRLCYRTTKGQTDPVTKKPKLKDDGSQRNELVMTAIYVSGTAKRTEGQGDEERILDFEPGSPCRIFVAGHRWGALIEAENKFGKPNVGDVMKIQFKGTEKSSMRGGADKKLWVFTLRRANPSTEAGDIAVAEAVYAQVKSGSTSDAGSSNGAGTEHRAPGDDDDIPFAWIGFIGPLFALGLLGTGLVA